MPVLIDTNGALQAGLATGGPNSKSIVLDSTGTIVFKASHNSSGAATAINGLLTQ